jgi:hypothetical protein
MSAICHGTRSAGHWTRAQLSSRGGREPFETAYMKELAYRMARNGYPWEQAPPGFAETQGTVAQN